MNEHLKKVIDITEDKKVVIDSVLDVVYMTTFADYFIIAIAQNDRQIAGIMNSFKEDISTAEKAYLTVEGDAKDGWVAIQYHEVCLHLFLPAMHDMYRLDELYTDATKIDFENL